MTLSAACTRTALLPNFKGLVVRCTILNPKQQRNNSWDWQRKWTVTEFRALRHMSMLALGAVGSKRGGTETSEFHRTFPVVFCTHNPAYYDKISPSHITRGRFFPFQSLNLYVPATAQGQLRMNHTFTVTPYQVDTQVTKTYKTLAHSSTLSTINSKYKQPSQNSQN